MAGDGETRRLAAIMATDVVGCSRLMRDDEAATLRTLGDYRKVMTETIERHQGRVIDAPGDAMLAEFASAVDAVRSSVEIQRELGVRNGHLADHRRMDMRIGINLGDVIHKDGALYGDGVNVAARLESLSDPGNICISNGVHEQVQDKLDLRFEDMGEHEVKNIARPVRAFRLIPEGPAPKQEATGSKAESEKPSIAILPFDNMSGDEEQEYFSDGITDDIITALSRNGGLFVIARNSSFAYRGKSPDIRKVGEELGVRYVLEGSVRRAGERVRITAQLIEAASGNHVWADKYDRELTDIFAVQDEITENVSGAVGSEIRRAEIGRAVTMSPTELGAWELSMRAWWHVQRVTKEDNAEAQDLCRQEIALMGGKATSYSALAFTHLWNSLFGWGGVSPQEAGAEAVKAAQAAISLDANDEVARVILATVYWFAGNLIGAVRECELAIEQSPNYNVPFVLGGVLLCRMEPDQYERASEIFQRGIRLGPRDAWVPTWTAQWSLSELVTGRTEQAIESAREAVRLGPHIPQGHRSLAAALALNGDMSGAKKAWADVMRVQPDFDLETYLPGFCKMFDDEGQIEIGVRAMRLASGAEAPEDGK